MIRKISLSPLIHTWIIDLDGTILIHNGYKNGGDKLIENAKNFIDSIPKEDYILFLTARKDDAKDETLVFLKKNGIRFNEIIFNMPTGERILVNDMKPSGLKMSRAVNIKRDKMPRFQIFVDENL